MNVIITLLVLLLSVLAITLFRFARSSLSYAWLAAALGGVAAWVSVFFWQMNLPVHYSPTIWSPVTLFVDSPHLYLDSYSWLFAIGLTALVAAVILTSPARANVAINPSAWAGSLALCILALVAVLADNPLTLVIVWTAIDLVEFLNTVRVAQQPELSERAVVSFSIRMAGTVIALWASVVNATAGKPFLFENASPQAGLFLILAVGLRLGILPLHLAFRSEPALRRGFGTVLRLITAASSLVILARLPASGVDPVYVPYLLAIVGVAGLYGAWNWFTASDEMAGRPYWIIGMSSLAMAAMLRGSPAASAAWSFAMLIFGGLIFLYSARNVWFSRILAGLAVLMIALPFTVSAVGWDGKFAWPGVFWPMFLIIHFLIIAGFIRLLFRPGEIAFSGLPTWAQSAYPAGMGILMVTALVSSLWGWPGAMQLGAPLISIVLLALAGATALILWRFRRFINLQAISTPVDAVSRLGIIQDAVSGILWFVYRLLRRAFAYTASLLEGDGGLLWTLLLLVLLVTLLQGQ